MTVDPIIAKIQGLLAKAESTEFEAEAEAFYAKAEELMTKHAVERWQLAQAGKVAEEPVKRTIIYSTTDANLPGKTQILAAAAKAAGVFVVLTPKTKKMQAAYLVGFESDCEFAELLYTSLLVQAMRFCPTDVRRVKARLTDYLLGFGSIVAGRVLEREKERESESSSDLLPALIDRDAQVKDAVGDFFPRLGKTKAVARRTDWNARAAGGEAGKRADISGGRNNVGGSRGQLGA
jgi:hypothetical protein